MNQQKIADLMQARMEAAAWCELESRRAPFFTPPSLRTPALRPELPRLLTKADLDAALGILGQRRRGLLGNHPLEPMCRGRLLICEMLESVSSGESEAATSGFFDIDDRPPWDTWLSRLEQDSDTAVTLISWVPERFELIEKASRSTRTCASIGSPTRLSISSAGRNIARLLKH